MRLFVLDNLSSVNNPVWGLLRGPEVTRGGWAQQEPQPGEDDAKVVAGGGKDDVCGVGQKTPISLLNHDGATSPPENSSLRQSKDGSQRKST